MLPGGGQPQKHDKNIAYGVEYVFMENGKQVKKMPIEIYGQTIWVECVEQQRQGEFHLVPKFSYSFAY